MNFKDQTVSQIRMDERGNLGQRNNGKNKSKKNIDFHKRKTR